jgi:conjugal transfer/entry exclusion protein
MEKKKKKDNADLFVIEDFKKQIADLENQIYVMMGALNNTEVLQVDDQQQYELPLNMFANINKQIEDLKFQIAKKSNDIDKPYLNEVEDKKRLNNLIVDVVLTNLKYYTYQKLKNENKLLDLYFTKKDLKDVVIKFGKQQ